MLRRKRVLDAINFIETDKVPMDLGAMRSTSISAFEYTNLRELLNLPRGLPMIYDPYQMLAIPEPDLLDALDCDVVFVDGTYSNAFNEKQKFEYFDFGGRLEALVSNKLKYKVEEDKTVLLGEFKMPSSSTVFNREHAGHDFNIDNLKKDSLIDIEEKLKNNLLDDRQVEKLAILCRNVRDTTDRAVLLNVGTMNLHFIGGIANGSMLCLLDPEYVAKVNQLKSQYTVKNYEKIIPAVKDNIDILLSGNRDMGTQISTIVAPDILNELYIKYFKYGNDAIKSMAPHLKTFLHSCGAIYEVLDYIIDANFDVINPVQWNAGERSYKEWKDKARNRITLWGGGVDSQQMLPFGTVSEIKSQVKEVVKYMKKDGGYVFSNIHNITAEVDPQKILAMYNTAKNVSL